MKKSLLLGLAATCATAALAETTVQPTIYPDASFQRISADGRIVVSEVYGTVTIYDLKEGTKQEYVQDDNYVNSYSLGLGNCLNADGSILLASTTPDFNAAYLEKGEWHELAVPHEENSNFANGITPDGSRICGSVGMSAFGLDDALMLAPAYWDRNADGTYGECNVLPHPALDFFDEKPQYVTAVSISDDGKTILGQMTFSSGMMEVPVLYKQDAAGEWSYSLPTKHLFNPDNLAPVENPGEGPEPPAYEQFMTEAEIAAYNQAVEDFFNSSDWSIPYPEYSDYMTADEIAAYNAAFDEYSKVYDAWEEKWTAYEEYRSSVVASSPNFVFNNVFITPDGNKYIGSLELEDPNADPWSWFPTKLYRPCVVDLTTGEITEMPIETTCLASGFAEGGDIILGYNTQRSVPMIGYVFKDGVCQTLQDYITAKSPEYGEWITKNMTHDVIVDYDPETFDEIIESVTFTGMPIATPDMSIIAMWNNSPWDDLLYAEGVVFDMKAIDGVSTITIERDGLTVDENGYLNVPADIHSVEVYSLSGARIKTIGNAEGAVDLGVAPGAYIVKGTRTNGAPSIIKVAK